MNIFCILSPTLYSILFWLCLCCWPQAYSPPSSTAWSAWQSSCSIIFPLHLVFMAISSCKQSIKVKVFKVYYPCLVNPSQHVQSSVQLCPGKFWSTNSLEMGLASAEVLLVWGDGVDSLHLEPKYQYFPSLLHLACSRICSCKQIIKFKLFIIFAWSTVSRYN